LYGYFDALICGDSLPYKKPHPHPFPLQHILQQFDVRPQQAMMVGDSINDIQAARAADMPVACVSYGYNHGNDIREHEPVFVVDTLTELSFLFRPAF